jgi:hypothetical protein
MAFTQLIQQQAFTAKACCFFITLQEHIKISEKKL